MDLKALKQEYADCSCGEHHYIDIEDIIIEHGVLPRVGELIKKYTELRKIYLVADENTMNASRGIADALISSGFKLKYRMYKDLRCADMTEVMNVEKGSEDCDIILSVGSGSLNDICRLAASETGKMFIIFATAPSMDGFASDTAPITKNNFKKSYQAAQPYLIFSDTAILASSPAVLKGAGFGDMMAKYIGLADWHISNVLSGEKICPKIEELTKKAADKIKALAPYITQNSEESAKAVAEALILTGIAMKFAHSSRPASGAEHIVSHFWEIKKLEEGKLSDFHGRKVAVATLLLSKLYHKLEKLETVTAVPDKTDWAEIKAAYGETLYTDVEKMNFPDSITSGIAPEALESKWSEIRGFIREYVPEPEELEALMKIAGTPTTISEIDVTPTLCEAGLKYHPYMRRRLTLTRLLPMLELPEGFLADFYAEAKR